MLEMDIVLRAVLSRMEVAPAASGRLEAHRRRMITVVPGEGAQSDPARTEAAAGPKSPTSRPS